MTMLMMLMMMPRLVRCCCCSATVAGSAAAATLHTGSGSGSAAAAAAGRLPKRFAPTQPGTPPSNDHPFAAVCPPMAICRGQVAASQSFLASPLLKEFGGRVDLYYCIDRSALHRPHALPALHRIRYGAVAPTFLLPLVHSVTKVFRRHSSFCWRCSQADRSAEGLRPGRDCAQTTGGLRPLRSEHDGPAAKVLDVGESGRRRFWPAEVIQMDHPVRVACLSFTAFHCHFTNFHCLSPRFCLRRSRFDNVFFAAVPPLGSLVRAQQLLSVCLSLRSYSTDCAVFV